MTEIQEDPFQEDLTTYKLSDGSYLVAEELEINGDTGSIFIANPVLVYFKVSQKTLIKEED